MGVDTVVLLPRSKLDYSAVYYFMRYLASFSLGRWQYFLEALGFDYGDVTYIGPDNKEYLLDHIVELDAYDGVDIRSVVTNVVRVYQFVRDYDAYFISDSSERLERLLSLSYVSLEKKLRECFGDY